MVPFEKIARHSGPGPQLTTLFSRALSRRKFAIRAFDAALTDTLSAPKQHL